MLSSEEDDVILNYLNDNGKMIEPTWYMPIIRTVLVNGYKGTRTSSVPNHNPRDIVANVKRLLNGESIVPMDPWYRGFIGPIEKIASNESGSTYRISGICEQEVDDTNLCITELPIGRATEDYREVLNALTKPGHGILIQDIKNYSTCEFVCFKILLSDEEDATTNMYLHDQNGVLKKYATPEQILEEFFNLRFQYYEKRMKMMLENLELELKVENEVKFILGLINGEIASPRERADLVQELRQRGFTPFLKKSSPVEAAVVGRSGTPSSTFIHGSDYDYLLSLDTTRLTGGKFQELLCAIRDKMKEEVEDFKKATTPKSLWLKYLESLEVELDKIDLYDANMERGLQRD